MMSRLRSSSVRNAGAVELKSRSPVDSSIVLVRLEGHVNLRAGVVQPHGAWRLSTNSRSKYSSPTSRRIVALRLAFETTASAAIVRPPMTNAGDPAVLGRGSFPTSQRMRMSTPFFSQFGLHQPESADRSPLET